MYGGYWLDIVVVTWNTKDAKNRQPLQGSRIHRLPEQQDESTNGMPHPQKKISTKIILMRGKVRRFVELRTQKETNPGHAW